MNDKPWYSKGLRFNCSQCGDCCTGAPGYVWVNAEEIGRLAAAIGQGDVDLFEQQYVRRVGIRKSLREYHDGACVFFDDTARRCTVYEARPRQCRTWPFWDSNVRTERAWEQTCGVCPGSGKGRLFSLEEIQTARQVLRV